MQAALASSAQLPVPVYVSAAQFAELQLTEEREKLVDRGRGVASFLHWF